MNNVTNDASLRFVGLGQIKNPIHLLIICGEKYACIKSIQNMAVSFFVLPKRHDKLSRRHICQISKTNNCNIRNVIHVSQNANPAVQGFNDSSYLLNSFL